MTIHPTAIIAKEAKIGANVEIGPYCVVGPHVILGDGCKLMSHVVIEGRSTIGKNNTFYPFCSVGHVPQDLKFGGEPSRLEMGDNNVVREYVTIHLGTEGGGMVTRVGNNCLFMVSAHIAHDCQVGSHVILANNATLAGHVIVGDHAILGGLSAVHQFVRIGKHAIVGGMSAVDQDVIPYASVIGERGWLAGLNLVGLKRRGFERDDIHALRNAYKTIFENNDGTLVERIASAKKQFAAASTVQDVITFMEEESHRSFCLPKAGQNALVDAA